MYSVDGDYTELSKIYGVGEPPNETILTSSETDKVNSLKVGASIHKEIRKFIRPHLQPGLKLSTLANLIENKCVELTEGKGINNGIGFPSSLSDKTCVAHFGPSSKFDVTLDEDSIVKIDFGVEVNGWITDSAFTIAFNDKYINLLDAVKDATCTGIKNAAIDVNIKEWSKDIQEVMESYEVEIDGKNKPIKVIKNLGGHNILKNRIHGGVFLPAAHIPYYDDNLKFKEGVYAIETFGSTESNFGLTKPEENTLYTTSMTQTDRVPKILQNFHKNLIDNFSTIPYSDRYLENLYKFSYFKPRIKDLVKLNIVKEYPPIYCYKDGMSAQYEHTIYLGDKKIVFTKSTDY